ncbi:MAG: hypothetical protein AAF420_12675 [Pseudomonadota bacterium]
MNEDRSAQVVERYKQEKINASVLANTTRLLIPDDEEQRLERRFNLAALILAIAVVVVGLYLYSQMSVVAL